MNAKHVKAILFSIGILGISTYQIHGNSSGASSPKTGAPGETTCTSCHSGNSLVTSGTQHARIQLKGSFSGGGYIPDSTYTLTLSYAESGKSTFGFQLTALSNGNAAGTFTSSTRTGTFSSTVNGKTRYYIEHNSTGSSGISKDSTAWTFQWKAPSSNVGNITFYAALNATNNNGSSSGDVIYNKTFQISPSSLLPVATAKLKSTLNCAGKSAEFEASGTNNTSGYSWSFPTGVPTVSSNQNPKINFLNAGKHIAILSVSNNKGISQKDTLSFTILDAAIKPSLNIKTPTVILCLGDTIKFNIGTTQKHTYTWSNGVTGRNNPVDTSGYVGVTALRDNGCSVKSDSVLVVGIPKPDFKVSYGLTNDSVCVNESLLVLLQNRKFADSYSIVSSAGPYFRDSFLIYPIKKGNNTFKYWAKSKIGCFSGPSETTTFIGIDTPQAPVISVISRLSDKILFGWNAVDFANTYEYSTDFGTNWKKSDSGLTITKQWINLDSATQQVDFWLRAETGNYCGYSQIGKTQAKGAGCNEPNWSLSLKDTIICKDSSTQINIKGLNTITSYSLLVNGVKFYDSVYTTNSVVTNTFKMQLLDSQQLLCGYFEKSIVVVVDSTQIIEHNFLPSNKILICGSDQQTKIPLIIKNYSSNYTYKLNNGNKDVNLDSINSITPEIGYNNWTLYGNSQYGCPVQKDSILLYADKIADAGFTAEWVMDFEYKFVSNTSDTDNYIHIWFDSTSNTQLNSVNTATILVDYKELGEGNVKINHQMISKNRDTLFNLNECIYESIQNETIRNLDNSRVDKKKTPLLTPNPVKGLFQLRCANCIPSDKFSIYAINGKLYGTFTIEEMKTIRLSNGLYVFIHNGENSQTIQKIQIEN